MMNIPPSEAKLLSLHDYESILWHWNDAQQSGDDPDALDAEATMKLIDAINADPRLTGAAAAPELAN
jgi:hypothetical protein